MITATTKSSKFFRGELLGLCEKVVLFFLTIVHNFLVWSLLFKYLYHGKFFPYQFCWSA